MLERFLVTTELQKDKTHIVLDRASSAGDWRSQMNTRRGVLN